MRIMMGTVTKLPTKSETSSGFTMKKTSDDKAEIYVYGIIGVDWFGDGVSAKSFADDLKALGAVKQIDLRINSEGGDVFAGKAMYSLLVEHKAKIVVHVDGLAASAASFLAMAGDDIEIGEGAFMMIHNTWTWAVGDSNDMRRTAELLDSVNATVRDVYVARTKNTSDDVKKWMDEETWMNGKECLARGFATKVIENMKVAASIRHPEKFKHLPAALRKRSPKAAAAVKRLAALAR